MASLHKIYKHWKHRKPPDGTLESQPMLCILPQPCVFQDSCPNAHSESELEEWRLRIQLENQPPLHVEDSTFSLQDYRGIVVDKLNELEDEEDTKSVLTEIVGDYSILCDGNLFIMHVDKNKELTWVFTIKCLKESPERLLERVFFMEDCPEFSMTYVSHHETNFVKLPEGCKLWENQKRVEKPSVIRIFLGFSAKRFGNYCQELIFDFGGYPKLIRKLGVQVATEETLAQTMKYNPEKYENNELTWMEKHDVIAFDGTPKLSSKVQYPLPPNIENLVVFDAFKHLDVQLTKQNYRRRLHTLLYIEEYQRRADLQNITFRLDEFALCLEAPESKKQSNCTASVLFDEYVLESLTRLVGRSGKALLRLNKYEKDGCTVSEPTVYEVIVQRILNNTLVLELHETVAELVRSSAIPVDVDVCFCLVDVFQPMHKAVDNVDLDLIFPDLTFGKCLPYLQSSITDKYLSKQQTRAVDVMLTSAQKAPVLLLGPFGAGKTRTLARVVEKLIAEKKFRVLICTHSNSAADHYIDEFFHPLHRSYAQATETNASPIPLRINWEHRYTSSVSDKVLAYCLQDKHTGLFASPTKEDLDKHSLIISTLVTSEVLSHLDLPAGYFSHIFIDEAAQAMEVEALVPLLLATKETKIVLAGDHMQMSEPLSSSVAKDLGLGKSLLERLFEYYPFDAECKLKLLENFRSYKEIVDISSHLFYEDSLLSKKLKPDDDNYPIEFSAIHGVETLSKENPSYENIAEATEVMFRISEIIKFWDNRDVEFDLSTICVVSFYPAQVRRIRKVLRSNEMRQVRVESVNNIQGLEFDILIISTVRTYCNATIYDEQLGKDLGFLSNPKLLNTALTRARYQVILVGEPVALCSIGECIACWKTILRTCDNNKTFYYSLSYEALLGVLHELSDHSSLENNLRTGYTSPEPNHRNDPLQYLESGTNLPYGSPSSHSSMSSASCLSSVEEQSTSSNSPPPPYDCVGPPFANSQTYTPLNNTNKPGTSYGQASHILGFRGVRFPPIQYRPPHLQQSGFTLQPCHRRLDRMMGHHTFLGDASEVFYPLPPRFIQPIRPCFEIRAPVIFMHRHQLVNNFPRHSGSPCYWESYGQPSYNMHWGIQNARNQSKLLLPPSKNLVNLRQKIHFVHEYSLYLLGRISAASEAKEFINSQVQEDTQQLNDLSQNHEIYEPAFLKMKTEKIESKIESTYTFVENQFTEYMKLHQVPSTSPDRMLMQSYGTVKKRTSELLTSLEHEEYRANVLNEYSDKDVELGREMKSLSYFVRLISKEVEDCTVLLNFQPGAFILSAKLEFIDQQTRVAEANRDELEQKLAIKKVEHMEKKAEGCSESLVEKSLHDLCHVPLPGDDTMSDCEVGAIENRLASATIEENDPDLAMWFSRRRNDPYVQEYVTSHERQLAERLPSPTPDEAEESCAAPQRQCRFLKRSKKKHGSSESCLFQGRKKSCKLFSRFKCEPTDDECDYSINPPYTPYANEDEVRSIPHVYEGTMNYNVSVEMDNIHGTVFTQNSLQVHVNGLRRNNRALPGDHVLVKVKPGIEGNIFDVPGEVLCVTRRASMLLSCQKSNSNPVVVPVKPYGPPVLLIRGVGSEKVLLDSKVFYNVKILDWPEDMKYPLGEIIKIVEKEES